MKEAIISSIITGVASIIAGFIAGYTYCIKISSKKNQVQKSKDNSIQIQIGEINGK